MKEKIINDSTGNPKLHSTEFALPDEIVAEKGWSPAAREAAAAARRARGAMGPDVGSAFDDVQGEFASWGDDDIFLDVSMKGGSLLFKSASPDALQGTHLGLQPQSGNKFKVTSVDSGKMGFNPRGTSVSSGDTISGKKAAGLIRNYGALWRGAR